MNYKNISVLDYPEQGQTQHFKIEKYQTTEYEAYTSYKDTYSPCYPSTGTVSSDHDKLESTSCASDTSQVTLFAQQPEESIYN